MVRRVSMFTAIMVLLLVTISSNGHAQTTCSGGYEYPAPTNPTVRVIGTGPDMNEIYALHRVSLAASSEGDGLYEPGSTRYTVAGPGGTSTVVGDEHEGGEYTPPVPGDYRVSASWRQFRCTDGANSTYWTVTAPPVPFTAVEGLRPKGRFATFRRPRAGRYPGDATLQATVLCPGSTQTRPGDVRVDVYYTLGRSRPTHRSHHLGHTAKGGCHTNRLGSNWPEIIRPGRYVIALGSVSQVSVTQPTRMRVLIELRERGGLIGRTYGTFSPVRTGEKVIRR